MSGKKSSGKRSPTRKTSGKGKVVPARKPSGKKVSEKGKRPPTKKPSTGKKRSITKASAPSKASALPQRIPSKKKASPDRKKTSGKKKSTKRSSPKKSSPQKNSGKKKTSGKKRSTKRSSLKKSPSRKKKTSLKKTSTRKTRSINPRLVCRYSHASFQGPRDTFEDRVITGDGVYAVLDGHGGTAAVNHFARVLKERLKSCTSPGAIKKIFEHSDGAYSSKVAPDDSGTTFTGIVLNGNKAFVINLGDSRTFVLRGDTIIHETTDHKPEDEEKRIVSAGGYVTNEKEGVPRVNGNLATSRAFGDPSLKHVKGKYAGGGAPVSPIPDVKSVILSKGDVIVIACDGIYDVLSTFEVARLVREGRKCDEIARLALSKGSTDNVSILILRV